MSKTVYLIHLDRPLAHARHYLGSTDDLERDPTTYRKIKNLIMELDAKGGPEEIERFISDMVDQYV